MSAFMCHDEHFRQLAGWLCNDDRSSLDWLARHVEFRPESGYIEANELATHIARTLKATNVKSLHSRYSDPDDMIGNEFEAKFLKPISLGELDRMGRIDLGKIAKATRCYEYQACESDDWEQTPAYRICQLIHKTIGERLPGFESAEWGTTAEFTEPAPEVVSLMSLCRR